MEIIRDANGAVKIRGLASPYYDPAKPGTEFRLWGDTWERMAPGCWDDVLASTPDVFVRVNHNRERNLGRTPNTLKLWTDNEGLKFEATLGENSIAADAISQIERSELKGCSYAGGTNLKNNAKWFKEGDKTICEIQKMTDLHEVSIVDSPAFRSTAVQLYRDAHEEWQRDEATRERLQKLEMLKHK